MAQIDTTSKTQLLAVALAAGATIDEAAKACGLSVRTVYRRLEDPDFVTLVREGTALCRAQAAGRIASVSRKAVDTLSALLLDECPKIRLGAARALLEHMPKLAGVTDMQTRLDELKALLQERLDELGEGDAQP